MTTYKPKRMSARFYEGAPAIVKQKIAFICFNGCENGVPYDVLLTEDDGHGNAVGLDFGNRIQGQHFFLSPYDALRYRARNNRQRKAWSELPEGVQSAIVSYLES